MKANEFVKKFGWERAKRELQYKNTMMAICSDDDWFDDLKRLVESHELVERVGGIEVAKNKIKANAVWFDGGSVFLNTLKKAIADVESC